MTISRVDCNICSRHFQAKVLALQHEKILLLKHPFQVIMHSDNQTINTQTLIQRRAVKAAEMHTI
jgi:hypothetical protein